MQIKLYFHLNVTVASPIDAGTPNPAEEPLQ